MTTGRGLAARSGAGVVTGAALLLLGPGATGAAAQPPEPGIEIYGFAGGYHFGNTSNVLKARRWAPAWGGGVFVPVSSNWGLLIDGVASRLKVDEGLFGPGTGHPQVLFYEARRDLMDDSVTTQQLITFHPSFVRRWRRGRLSFYFGGGLALEHQRQTIRYRRVNYFDETEREAVIASGLPYVDAADLPFSDSDETGIHALSERRTDSRDSVFATGLTARGGILVDAARRVVVRVGYSYIRTYIDSPASQSIEVGIGYRF